MTEKIKRLLPNRVKPIIKFEFGKLEEINISNLDEYNNLIELKNKIDDLNNNKLWDKAKKITNNYELIYLPNKKFKCDSISKYEPLSRSYFKLWEMLYDFNLINDKRVLNIATLAEGPGGFLEAIVNYRTKLKFKDNIHAITLKSYNKDIPGWNKSTYFLKKNNHINVHYGSDNTGNLYKLNNILNFKQNFNRNKADFITADGGFDFSYNFNKQEQMSYRILFCEIVTALSIQSIGGSFICKFFDIYTNITHSYLALLSYFYKEVYITKPYTSRPANSEKYIVCKKFMGIDTIFLEKLYIIVNNWDYIEKNNLNITNLFIINNKNIIENINSINSFFYNIQTKNISNTLYYINTYLKQNIDYVSNLNHTCCVKWCKKYNISINYNSKYLIK